MSSLDKNRRRALDAASWTAEHGESPGATLDRALVFEDYLNGGLSQRPDGAPAIADELDDRHSIGPDTPITRIPVATAAKIRSILGAKTGESLLSAVERYRDRLHNEVVWEQRIDAAGGTQVAIADHEPELFQGALWVDPRPGAGVKYLYRVSNGGEGDEAWLWCSSWSDVVTWLDAGERPDAYTWREAFDMDQLPDITELHRATPIQTAEFYSATPAREVTEARARLLNQLANFVSFRPYLAEWLRGVSAALLNNNPWPLPPDQSELAEARSWARHGYEIAQRSATWSDHGVAPKWLTENHDPALLTPATPAIVSAEVDGVFMVLRSPWPAPPDHVEVLHTPDGAELRRSSWSSSEHANLWQWFTSLSLTPSTSALSWDNALAVAGPDSFPLVDVTAELLEAVNEIAPSLAKPRHELREADPRHDDPARSSKPERYEIRHLPTDDEETREVLVCLECIQEHGEPAGRGNVVDVERHDAFHDQQSPEGATDS